VTSNGNGAPSLGASLLSSGATIVLRPGLAELLDLIPLATEEKRQRVGGWNGKAHLSVVHLADLWLVLSFLGSCAIE